MRWIKINIIILFIAAAVISLAGTAEAAEKQQQPPANVTLTDQQKNEIEQLEAEILKKRKDVISKYVQYGVLPKERGEHIKNHIDKHFEMMKQNGFVPKPHPHAHKFEKRH
ncbi:YckD family protein [Bacillus cabrialesii]|uniref:YckD family protein n=1 Tax=Bacillus cabrialesii TaxID=2487276 RepID=UPI0028F81246|nr:YckD family protein [Bacillus cabrialesii]MDU0154799.1 YckD family protein [Bacillus cabrialesii]